MIRIIKNHKICCCVINSIARLFDIDHCTRLADINDLLKNHIKEILKNRSD